MKFKQTVLAAVALLMGATLSGPAFAVNDEPLTDNWAPSEWGPDDKAGAVNRTTAAMVLKAV
ncbi:MAG: cyclase family protein, partial [Proteobacteria bacterium]|nr:cyclase family protein [Pseudomonadota bacterium]